MVQGATWVGFASGKDYRYIPIHAIAEKLPQNMCKALPLFHALTGCDTVSAFHGKGKKTAWEVWKNFAPLTGGLLNIINDPSVLNEDDL